MKRTIVFFLAVMMCLTFVACQDEEEENSKSDAVKNVESMIDDLPAVSMETYDEILQAREKIDAVNAEYNKLSEEEKNDVDNKGVLDSECMRLFESEYEQASLLIQYINLNIDYVISGNVTIWDNVGASKFFDYQKDVVLVGENGYDGLISQYGADSAFYIFWAAGFAVDKDYYGENFNNFSTTKIKETEQICQSYVQSTNNIKDSYETIKGFINIMVNDYSDEYQVKIEALQSWWVETSMYADHALNPDGNLNSYASAASEYQNNIQRYQKQAGY